MDGGKAKLKDPKVAIPIVMVFKSTLLIVHLSDSVLKIYPSEAVIHFKAFFCFVLFLSASPCSLPCDGEWVARGKLWLKMFWPLEVCQSKMRGWKSLFWFSVNLLDYIFCYLLKTISFSLVLLFCFDKFYPGADYLFWQWPWIIQL